MKQDFIAEQIKTIRNLCDVALLLRNLGKDELLPTVLEEMFWEVQSVNDEYCVAEV